MNILIPMAGEGSRFASKGYQYPKPLIDVNGKPMIQRVVENLNFKDANYIFLVRKAHLENYPSLVTILDKTTNGRLKIVEVNSLTEGAACTALLAKDLINNSDPLMIANSDQLVDFSTLNLAILSGQDIDGIIFIFRSTHPKWSFVRLSNKSYKIIEVAEKNPISDMATCGIYWFRKGSDFVRSAEEMIKKNIRVNNEFYIAPAFNQMLDGALVYPFEVNKMHGLGTPEDLEVYLHG